MHQTTINPNDGDISLSVGKKHNLNVTLSSETHEQLSRLARSQHISMAIVIRQLIDWRYTMDVQNIPVCASGQRCFVPHMHPPPQKAPHQTIISDPEPKRTKKE